MQARIAQPATTVPGAMQALIAFSHSSAKSVPAETINLINLRASQINGCGVCVALHTEDMRKAGEPNQRIDTVAAWREAPYFSDAERAALALTEAATRLSDRPDPVPDDVWADAARHYDEAELAALTISIAAINVWNRLNVATRQVAGEWTA
jgi:AhpD family alkylhydroperoxidase